jgi:hypothetical protein
MTRRRIDLNFARTRPPLNRIGVALFAVGAACAALAVAEYRSIAAENAGLELRLAAIAPRPTAAVPDKAATRAAEEAAAAVAELAMPWSVLLEELEQAGADNRDAVALLAVEPDREKQEVQVQAEARSLPIALKYVERLQASSALRFPMLESHEVQLKDPQRPVRFQVRAEWSTAP